MYRLIFASLLFCLFANSASAQNDPMYVSPQGNVGIGTNTPNEKLTINGNVETRGNEKLTGTLSAGAIKSTGNMETDRDITAQGNLKASGIKATGRVMDQTGYVTPVGGIIMYSTSSDNVKLLFDESGAGKANTAVQGWAICNGKNGTPDLRGRFIVGAGPTDSRNSAGNGLTDYRMGEQKGEEKHTLSTGEMPRHNHPLTNIKFNTYGKNTCFACAGDDYYLASTNDRNETTGKMGEQGNSEAHENRPPYYAMLYIMKL